jgi:hypothetical protein
MVNTLNVLARCHFLVDINGAYQLHAYLACGVSGSFAESNSYPIIFFQIVFIHNILNFPTPTHNTFNLLNPIHPTCQ